MRVLIAPDKFKGSLSATEVADNLAHGLARAGVDSVTLPLADGGDGSVAAALAAGMRSRTCVVAAALGRPHHTTIAIDEATAVVEVANTCGLATLPRGVLAPMTASSYGFGEAIRHVIDLGARRVVLALGGSASTDGGVGTLAALGYTFHDHDGRRLTPTAADLHRIDVVCAADAPDLRGIELVVASDVTSPLTGPSGAAAVYGPQKGATAVDIARLENGLDHLVTALQRSGWDNAAAHAATPGAGAAGGCGFAGLLLGARIVSGADYFLDLLDFDRHLLGTDLVITGEGRLDQQTLTGKLPAVVARRAAPIPVVAVVGRNDLTCPTTLFADTYAVVDYAGTDTAHDPKRTATQLRHIGAQIGQRAHTYRPNRVVHADGIN
ncbi:glycerate kinase [Nocardia sp. NPDC052112]|uniref:glycerate kinase n=1 Tax=Nocardia sp. NPDC052112 TaxID=3155646 RepID=UPI00342F03DD